MDLNDLIQLLSFLDENRRGKNNRCREKIAHRSKNRREINVRASCQLINLGNSKLR